VEPYIWSLVGAIVSAVCAAITAWIARRAASADTRKHVDELADTVEHFAKIARREQMRRLRSAQSGPQTGGGVDAGPPELLAAAPPALTGKAALRARLLKRG